MAEVERVDDHGLEVIKKAAFIPDDTTPTLYAFRMRIIDAIEGSFAPSGLQNGGKITEVTLNSATWSALPTIPLTDRNAISIQNRSGVEIKINYDNTVSGYVGMVLPDGGERFYDIKDDIVLYGKSNSGTPIINIEEIS